MFEQACKLAGSPLVCGDRNPGAKAFCERTFDMLQVFSGHIFLSNLRIAFRRELGTEGRRDNAPSQVP